jgi:uncharacterized protein YndB with AHSA1/START domain
MNTDRIEKRVLLRAPLHRVWRALSDPAEFGSWFGMKVDGPFEPGRRLRAEVVPTTVDPEVAKAQEAYKGMSLEITVEHVEPERLFSFRWTHPPEPGSTLVEFTLEQQDEGVLLTVTESGFDQISEARRASMFAENEQGWAIQMRLVEAYLLQHA